ncbi:guanylate cyclase [Plakobranchus ocellatus]|uniref:Guanylate cyclase n=1 Tax=Plakobranchus ocellatus TaxID=259542 RepID=A0AAV3Z3I8_9GAST|nr:guanylate cyclase [Plakobranchus ocellatus]
MSTSFQNSYSILMKNLSQGMEGAIDKHPATIARSFYKLPEMAYSRSYVGPEIKNLLFSSNHPTVQKPDEYQSLVCSLTAAETKCEPALSHFAVGSV